MIETIASLWLLVIAVAPMIILVGMFLWLFWDGD
jgi:hypothetical protein